MVADGRFDEHDIEHDIDAPWRRPSDVGDPTDAGEHEPVDRALEARSSVERVTSIDDPSMLSWAPSGLTDHAGVGESAEGLAGAGRQTEDPTGSVESADVRLAAGADGTATGSEPAPTARRDGPWSTTTRRGAVIVGGSLIVALAVVLGAIVAPFGREPTPVATSAPMLPVAATIGWTTRFDAPVEATAVGEGLFVVASGDGVIALDDDGAVVWRQMSAADAGGVKRIVVMGEHVVAMHQGTNGLTEVRAFDRADGTEVWRTRGGDGAYTISGPDHDPMIVGRTRVEGATLVTLVDPVDGSTIGDPLRLSAVAAVGDALAVESADRQVAIWSTDDVDFVTGPVDAFNLRAVAPIDGAVVALDLEGRIVAFDEGGERTDELLLVTGPGDAIGQVELAGVVPDAGIGVISGESSLGFTVVGGQIATLWSRDGRVTSPVATSQGARSVLIVPGDVSGEISEVIIDPADGRSITTIDGTGRRERISTLAHNGYLVAPTVGAAEREIHAFGYDGAPLWSLSIAAEADYALMGGVIVVVENTSSGGSVSIAR